MKMDNGQESTVGLTLKARCTKNKTWPPFKVAEYVLYTMNVETEDGEHSVSAVDAADEAWRWGMFYGLVDKRGPMYEYQGTTVKGQNEFKRMLRDDNDLFEGLVSSIYKEALDRRG